MADGGLLGGIMNPAQADVLGAMDKGRDRQATAMAGDILGQQIGGQIGALARLDPDKGIALAKITNTPIDDAGRIKNLLGSVMMTGQLWDAGLKSDAINTLRKQIDYTESKTGEKAVALRTAMASLEAGATDEVGQGFLSTARGMNPLNAPPSAKEQAETRKLDAETASLTSPVVKRNTTTVGDRIIDSDTGDVIYDGGGTGIQIPKSIINDLPNEMAARVADVFVAAGGGKDGIKAANEERVIVQEDMRRGSAYESLSVAYPGASTDEMTQLRTAIDTAPTVEKGMAIAETVRTNQRAAQKASVMTDRSLYLANNILDNVELSDVIGSSEGKYGGTDQDSGPMWGVGGFISDFEAEAIADIEEITNILTVPAMEIMTGILSESDLKLLKTISGGAFNRTRGIDRFKKDVGQVQTILNRASVIGKMKPKDREAAIWATNAVNMNTPQAKQIRKKLGL